MKTDKNNWNGYYNEAESHEGAESSPEVSVSQSEQMLRKVAELISLATYTMQKQGINIRNVNEPLINAEKELLKILNKKK